MIKSPIVADCIECGVDRNHRILKRHDVNSPRYQPDSNGNKAFSRYAIIQCMGCNKVSFAEIVFTVTGINKESNNRPVSEKIRYIFQYPEYESILEDFLSEEEIDLLPSPLDDLYYELRGAFKEYSVILAGLGLRTIVEVVCILQDVKGRNLEKKIVQMAADDIIKKKDIPILDKLREIGNLHAHSIERMSDESLEHALQIINHMLRDLYVIPNKADKIYVPSKNRNAVNQTQ